MIQLSSLLPAMLHGPVRPAPPTSEDARGFALALGALVVPRAGAPGAKAESEPLAERQMLADPGKDLPELPTGQGDRSTEEQDAREDGAHIAFAWFATSPAPAVPPPPGFIPAAPAIEPATPRVEIAAIADLAVAPAPGKANAEVAAPALAAPQATAEHVVNLTAPADVKLVEAPSILPGEAPDLAASKAPMPTRPATKAATNAPANPGEVASPAAAVAKSEQLARRGEPSRALEATASPAERSPGKVVTPPAPGLSGQPRTMQPQPAVALPSLMPFYPIIATGAQVAAPPSRRALAIDSAALALLPAAPDPAQPNAVSAPTDIQQVALDMRRQEWVGKMVEQIETLRDAAPVRETRLSLAPEALGKVEVSIRHEGDRVHVHFTTETHAARQLIADAQPRLSELAEARGLKLGQTSFESGTAGQGPSRDTRDNPAPQKSPKPLPATVSAAGPADDERIA